ncbi:MAG: cupin domain-containing protein [Brevefilum sp.]
MPQKRPNIIPRLNHWRTHLNRLISPESAPSIEIKVGTRLRVLRQARDLSQRELADLSGLNFNTLSLIETEKSSPNVSTLQQLAEALEVPITAFFEPPAAQQPAVVYQKSGERPSVAFDHGTFADLGGGLTLGEGTPLLLNLDPGQEFGEGPVAHTGQEFVYCLSGELVYSVDGQNYHLASGDSLIFEASLTHLWSNPGEAPAQALVVICPADRDDRSVTRHLPVEDEG